MSRLIAIVGIDGCGKSTQVDLLANALTARGETVHVSKAYTSVEHERFADYIQEASPIAVMFLFQALHTEQRRRAEDHLAFGHTVIADRWDETYEQYHSQHGILAQFTRLRGALNKLAFANRTPDVTFFLDTPAEVAHQRVCERHGTDIFLDSIDELRSAEIWYKRQARRKGWVQIDGTTSDKVAHEQILAWLSTPDPRWYQRLSPRLIPFLSH